MGSRGLGLAHLVTPPISRHLEACTGECSSRPSAPRSRPARGHRAAGTEPVGSLALGWSCIRYGTRCAATPTGPSPPCAPWATLTSSCSGRSAISAARPSRSVRPWIAKDCARLRPTSRPPSCSSGGTAASPSRTASAMNTSSCRASPRTRRARSTTGGSGPTASTQPAPRRAGIWLAFHNEPDHMTPIDGKVPYDVFLERTDPSVVRHQLDVGNMAMGGGDPFVYLQRYRDRYWSFHLKDVVANRSSDTELGTGTLDFRRLLAAVPDVVRKPCYVEQEGAADSLASARRNHAFLEKLEF